jgi:hypothetical protein
MLRESWTQAVMSRGGPKPWQRILMKTSGLLGGLVGLEPSVSRKALVIQRFGLLNLADIERCSQAFGR